MDISFRYIFLFIMALFLGNSLAFGQSFNLPIDESLPKCNEENYFSNTQNHTVIKPVQIDILKYQDLLDSCFSNKEKKHWILDKNFLSKIDDRNGIIINPVLTNLSTYNLSIFTENGINIKGWLGKNFTVNYTGSYIYTLPKIDGKFSPFNDVYIPHFGKAMVDSSKGSYSYLNQTGNVSYQVADFMNLQVGRDKVFFGDGYRSLFVSDNSNAYPYFKGTVDIWKVKYTILYSFFREKDSLTATNFNAKKYSASHILSWNIGKRLNFNMFETVIWRGKDSLGYRGFDVNYLNPIIFYRPVEFSLGSPDNVIMGFGFRLRIFKTTHLYGQFLLDEFKLSELKAKTGWWGNKFGIQGGIKTYRLFGIKNLFALGEINLVKPFTYSHWSFMENNGNSSQPLAHPLGANFIEGIANLRYQKNRWNINTLIKMYAFGTDDTLNRGNNIYRSYNDNVQDYGNKLLQGNLHKITSLEISASYILNPKWMLAFKFGYRYDLVKIENNQQMNTWANSSLGTPNIDNQFVFFGFFTSIGNREGHY